MLGRGWCHGNPWPVCNSFFCTFSVWSIISVILAFHTVAVAWVGEGERSSGGSTAMLRQYFPGLAQILCVWAATHCPMHFPNLHFVPDWLTVMKSISAVFLLPTPCWGGQDSGAVSDAALQAARMGAKYIPCHCHSQLRSENCCLGSEQAGAWLCCLKLAEKIHITNVSN